MSLIILYLYKEVVALISLIREKCEEYDDRQILLISHQEDSAQRHFIELCLRKLGVEKLNQHAVINI